ncbi:MAG: alpha-amylase, partial [Muribaculaceae bacterium]|nr:alpha-amylase [Muribaculaceae bacterium]
HATKTDYSKHGIRPDNHYVVKGNAGSPYAIKDYYDVCPDLAENIDNRIEEFEALVARTHKEGMKVLIDFVPNHTARQYHSDKKPSGIDDFGVSDNCDMFFSPQNNYYYITRQQFCPSIDLGEGADRYVEFPAKATGNDCFNAFCGEYDWYETVKLNYGKDYGDGTTHFDPIPNTWLKMLHILRYWAAKGVDGFRCDMVFMVPLEFWNWVIPNVKKDYPHVVFIGEIYDVNLYRPFLSYGCFDYLYDKVNLYDTLVGIQRHNVSAAQLTHSWQAVDGIGNRMLNFLENHDEVRFGSREYAENPLLVVPSLVVSSMINTGPMMIYYGQELGEQAKDNEGFAGDNNRTTIFDYWSLDTVRRWYNNGECDGAHLTSQEKWLRSTYAKILSICNKEKAVSEGTFFDLMYVNLNNPDFNPHRQFAFLRHHGDDTLLIVANFDHQTVDIKVNIPNEAFDYMDLPDGQGMCVELLSGTRQSKRLTRGERFELSAGANSASIWRIRKKNFKPI